MRHPYACSIHSVVVRLCHRTPFLLPAAACAVMVAASSALMGRDQSLWFDEQYSLMLAGRPVSEMIALTAVDAHPPLYYLLLKAWLSLVHGNVAMLRLLNCLLLGAAVLILLIMLRDLFGTRAAGLCMPFLLCGGFMLRYGYELRMYAAAMLITVFGTYALLRATLRPTHLGWWGMYAIIVALGMYTLYLTAFVWLTHAMWLVRYRSWRGLAVYLVSIVLYLPWMPVLLDQMHHSVFPPVRRAMNMSGVANTVDVVLLGMGESELPSLVSLLVLVMVMAVLALLVSPAAIRAVISRTDVPTLETPTTPEMPAAPDTATFTLIVMLSVLPFTGMAVWSAARELFNGGYGFFSVRYLSMVMPWFYVMLALVCVRANRIGNFRRLGNLARLVYMAIVVTLAAGTVMFAMRGNYSFDRSDTPGSAALSQRISCSASHPVVAQDEYTYIDAYWYYRDCPAYYFLDAKVIPARGGYAPLRGSTAQLRDIDELDADQFTLLTWSTQRNYDRLLHSSGWRRGTVIRSDANAAVSYHRR